MKFKLQNPFKKEQKKLTLFQFISGIIAGLLILLILFLGVVAWGIYKLDWNGAAIEAITKIFPYPAARVNGQFIPFYDYLRNFEAADKYLNIQRKAGFTNIPDLAQLKKTVLEDRLIDNIFMYKIADQVGVTISDEQIKAKLDEIIKNQGDAAKLSSFLNENYGLSIAEYEKYFITPNLYQDQTELKIENDKTINGESRNKIEEALTKLKSGQSFDEVLKKYGETDTSQSSLTGNFLRGELPKTLEDQLFSMSAGSRTDIITLPGSYSIVQLVKKDTDKGVLTLKAIVVKIKTLNDLIQDEKSKSKITIYAY
ncbi:MAG: SurA N-terminal domain-containing protein [Patescibacteria group bacterium]|nr:SurA N-terminal domain-containing protein [Patescibacteria group bacterium]